MKKPEKKDWVEEQITDAYFTKDKGDGYNQACDDWEKFLPSRAEIEEIIDDCDNGEGDFYPLWAKITLSDRIWGG